MIGTDRAAAGGSALAVLADDSRQTKLAVIVAALALCAGTLLSHQYGSVWPWLPIGLAVALGTVLLVGWLRRISLPHALVVLVGCALLVRLHVFLFPEGMIGQDPDKIVVSISRIIQDGSLGHIDGIFYRRAPVYYLYAAVSGQMSGLSGRFALTVYPIVLGLLYPLVGFTLARRVGLGRRGTLACTAFLAVSATGVARSFKLVPETASIGLFLLAVFLLVRYRTTFSIEDVGLLSLVLVALAFTHKLPVFMLVAILTGVYVLWKVTNPWPPVSALDVRLVPVVLLAGLILYVQWTVITTFFRAALLQFLALSDPGVGGAVGFGAGDAPTIPGGAGGTTTEQVLSVLSIQPQSLRVLYNVGYLVVASPIAGLAWLYLFLTDRSRPGVQVILAGASITVLLVAASLFLPVKHNVARFIIATEPFFAVLIAALVSGGVGLGVARRHPTPGRQALSALGFILICVVVASQVLTPAVYPDATQKPRKYLTGPENDAKRFATEHRSGEIWAGPFYFGESTPPFTAERSVHESVTFRNLGDALESGLIDPSAHRFVMYRQDKRIYRLGGSYRLTWDPGALLDRKFDRIYANRDVRIYNGH